MHAKLVVVGGDAKAAEINLKLPTIIGRGRNASLTLAHPLVSRQHCEIVEHEGRLLVRDLGSLNGTFVGNERITESILAPGELLTVGTVTFRAVYEAPRTSGRARRGSEGRPTAPAAETLPAAGNAETVDFSSADADEQPVEPRRRTSDSAETEPFPPGPPSVPSPSPGVLPALPVREARGRSGAVFPNVVNAQAADAAGSADEDVEFDLDGRLDELEELVHEDSSEEFHLGEAPPDDQVPPVSGPARTVDLQTPDADEVEEVEDVVEDEEFAEDDVDPVSRHPATDFRFSPPPTSSQTSNQPTSASDSDEPEVEGADEDLRSFLKGLQ
ncbi:MAG: FHA domain-containing protein [Pirellulaceae bacterium]|nr:FHA domain-containing protein [Pirellulaceae bacterium]